jgi:tetratricopeptide (TPR) repeat protein
VRRVRSLAIALTLCVSALAPATAEAKWTQIRSANFLFIGDAPESQIRRIAQKLEQFREVMLRALPGATAASPVPTVVMVFATDRSLQPVKPLFRGNAVDVGGYFQGGEDVNYVSINAEFADFALLTIFHEYSHFLVSNSMGQLPAWVSEGLAEVYEMVQERDGGKKALVGLAPGQHVGLLKGSTLIPIRDLMAVDHESSMYNEGSRRGVFYAQSWALVHYLSFGNAGRAKQFSQLLSSLRSGGTMQASFDQAFGADAGTLDRELFDYVRQFAFPAMQFDFGERVAATAVPRGQTLDDLEAEIYVADLQSRMGREAEARTRLAAVLKQKPDASRATASLGLQELRAGRLDAALPLLERAAAQGQDDASVQAAYGRGLIARLSERSDPAAATETLQKARTALARAVQLDRDSAFAAGMLGYIELVSGTDLPRAVSLLERAVVLAPSREQYRLFLAQALLRQREFSRATAQLGPLLAGGRRPEIREQARTLLGVAGDLQKQPTAAPPANAQPTATDLAALADLNRLTARPSDPAQSSTRPDLRAVGPGETRARGMFRAVECAQGSIVLLIESDGSTVRLRTKQLSDVDFISYRAETPGSVNCGTLPMPQPVLATYRANASGTGSTATIGDAVAIELVPDGFIPR